MREDAGSRLMARNFWKDKDGEQSRSFIDRTLCCSSRVGPGVWGAFQGESCPHSWQVQALGITQNDTPKGVLLLTG